MKTEEMIEAKINDALLKHNGDICILFCEQKKLFSLISPDGVVEAIKHTLAFSNEKLKDTSFSLLPNQTIIIDVTHPGAKILVLNEFGIESFPSALFIHKSEIRDFVPFLYTIK